MQAKGFLLPILFTNAAERIRIIQTQFYQSPRIFEWHLYYSFLVPYFSGAWKRPTGVLGYIMLNEREMLNLMEKDSARKGIESSPCANTSAVRARPTRSRDDAISSRTLYYNTRWYLMRRSLPYSELPISGIWRHWALTNTERLPPHPDHVTQAARFLL